MACAGLSVRTDEAGNLIGVRSGKIGVRSGKNEGLPSLVLGSHTDTVPGGGRFDGALGVLAAVEVARTLHEAGESLMHPLEVVDFTAEEPTDQGPSMIGSRAWAGTLDERLLAARDARGLTLAEALERAGGDATRIQAARRLPGTIAAYLELHIEQGVELARSGVEVGIVTGIAGIARHIVVFEGEAAHSGTTSMETRRDALAAAAELILAVERHARASERELVATAGDRKSVV